MTTINIRDFMEASIQCNNVGVVMLRSGGLNDALEIFKGAANIMHTVSTCIQEQTAAAVLEVRQDQDVSEDQSLAIGSPQVDSLRQAKDELLHAVEQARTSSTGVDAKDNHFLFAQPMLIDSLPQNGSEITSCAIESASIVYNMGLAYHLIGSNEHLQKALSLFDMAFTLAYSESTDSRASKIIMASLNNAGEIYHLFGNYTLSRQYLDTLCNYILTLPPVPDDEVMRERHQILLNTMLLNPPQFAGAA